MKQTEREHESVEKAVTGAGQAGPDKREEGGAARPQSWRQYIEQAEAAEKQAEREAARARAARTKKEKRSAAALKQRAKGALDSARTALSGAKEALDGAKEALDGAKAAMVRAGAAGKRVRRGAAQGRPAREQAAPAAQVPAVIPEGRSRAQAPAKLGRVGRAAARVRSVVDRHPVSPLLYVTLLAVVIGISCFNGSYIRAYAMNVNGQEVGVVSSPDEKDAIVSNIESRASDILGEQFDYDADISITQIGRAHV